MLQIKNFLSKNLSCIYTFVLFIFGLTPALWYRETIIAGEEYYALDYSRWGKLFETAWVDRVNFGEYSVLTPFKFQQVLFDLLNLFNFDQKLILAIWNILLFEIAVLGIFKLLKVLYEYKVNQTFLVIVSLYYLYTPYFLNISPFLTPARIVHALLPIVFLQIAKIHTDFNLSIKRIILLTILLTLGSPMFVNIPIGAAFIFTVTLTFLLVILKKNTTLKYKTLGLIAYFLGYVLLNVWWIAPVGYKQISSLSSIKNEAADFVTIDKSKPVDVLTLFGSWAFREKIYGTDLYYFPYSEFYDSFLGILARYIPFVITVFGIYALTSLSHRSYKYSYLIFISLLQYILFVLLSKGTLAPFGYLFALLYKYLPAFWMFREPYAKFDIIASFFMIIILPIGIEYILSLKRRSINLFLSSVLMFSLVFLSFPFITSKIVWDVNNNVAKSYKIIKTDSWIELENSWLPKNGNYLRSSLNTSQDTYNWPSGYKGDPYLMLTNANILALNAGYNLSENPYRSSIITYLLHNLAYAPEKFISECSKYNIAGVILQKDVEKNIESDFDKRVTDVFSRFSSNLEFDNEAAQIKSCQGFNETQLFDITSKDNIVNIHSTDFNYYQMLKETVPVNIYYRINDNVESDIYFLNNPKIEENNMTFSLDKIYDKSDIVFYKNLDKVRQLQIDNKMFSTDTDTMYKFIELDRNNECCKELTLIPEDEFAKVFSIDSVWYQVSNTATNTAQMKRIENSAVELNSDHVYILPLNSVFMNAQNVISLTTDPLPVGMIGISVLTVTDAGDFQYLLNYKVPIKSDKANTFSINFDPIRHKYFIDPEHNQFYLALYGFQITDNKGKSVDYPQGIKINPRDISITNILAPIVYMRAHINPSNTIINPDFIKINNSVYLLNLNDFSDIESPYLVFKNSYNKNWKLIEVSEKDVRDDKHQSDIWLLKKALVGTSPDNIENYSNGWSLSRDTTNDYMIVFVPSLIVTIFGKISLYSFCAIILYILLVRFGRRLNV